MKQLTFIACTSLLASSVALDLNARPLDSCETRSEAFVTNLDGLVPDGARPVTDQEATAVVGTGWRSDFWCGAAAGAGLVLSATGVLAPVGVGMSAAGIYCALYL